MMTYMVVVSAAAISYVPDTNGTIFENFMAVLDNLPHIFKIVYVFIPV